MCLRERVQNRRSTEMERGTTGKAWGRSWHGFQRPRAVGLFSSMFQGKDPESKPSSISVP